MTCGICGKVYDINSLDKDKMKRMKKNDFGVQGSWHCHYCALLPLGIYTTWISLSELKLPNDSILGVCPGSHKLKLWDYPNKRNSQLPGDYTKKMKWLIPTNINYGDIIIFNIKTIHGSSVNKSYPRKYRCSFDTRIQLIPNNCKPKYNIKNKINIYSPHPKNLLSKQNNIDNISDDDQENISDNDDIKMHKLTI